MRLVQATVFATVVLASSAALAGGTFKGPYKGPGPFCRFYEDAHVLVSYTDTRLLRDEVRQRYEHAVDVATSNRAIYSTSPLFVWASEAKVSCAQAIGYLRKPLKWRKRPNYVTLQKCECFYDRMMSYLPR